MKQPQRHVTLEGREMMQNISRIHSRISSNTNAVCCSCSSWRGHFHGRRMKDFCVFLTKRLNRPATLNSNRYILFCFPQRWTAFHEPQFLELYLVGKKWQKKLCVGQRSCLTARSPTLIIFWCILFPELLLIMIMHF